MLKHIIKTTIFVSLLALAACSDSPPTEPGSKAAVSQAEPAKPVMRAVVAGQTDPQRYLAVLRTQMPEQAMAYLRLPMSLSSAGDPSQDQYARIYQSAAWQSAEQAVVKGLGKTMKEDLAQLPGLQLTAELILEVARTPLELVVLPPANPQIPVPAILATVGVKLSDPEKINNLISHLVLAQPTVKIGAGLDDSGLGWISINGMPVQMYFDAAQQRLYLLSGIVEPKDQVRQMVLALKPTPAHPMHSVEARMDESGSGLFAWISPPQVMAVSQQTGLPWGMLLAASGLSEAQAIALGGGYAGGKRRLRLDIDMPYVGMRRFLPKSDLQMGLQAAGRPDLLLALSVPSAQDIAGIEQMLKGMLPPESMQKYQEAKKLLEDTLGIRVEQILNAVGPELVFLSDEAGQYTALRLRDPVLFKQLMERLNRKLELGAESREINAQTIHHLQIPSIYNASLKDMEPEQGKEFVPILKRFYSLPSHIFWMQDGDYVLMSALPQLLIDRGYVTQRTSIADWLSNEQKVDTQHASMLASGQSEDLPALLYYLELQGLQTLADLAETQIDMYALPTAREAGLNTSSSYSAQLDSSESNLSLQLSYEHNPAELLLGGNGMTGIAVVGILAAVAIPAYQDYTIRARISQGMVLSQRYQSLIAEHYTQNQSLPAQQDLDTLLQDVSTETLQGIHYDENSGRLILVFSISQLGSENQLYLTPGLRDGQIIWQCQANIQQKYLPQACHQ